jgi:hypothetical protein
METVSTKSLDPERNKAARAFVRSLIDRDFGGLVTAAAKRWGLSHSIVYEFLNGTRGAGIKLLDAVSRYSGVSIEEIVGGAPPMPHLRVVREHGAQAPMLFELPGYAEAEAAARKRVGFPEWVFQRVRGVSGLEPDRVTAELLLALATIIAQHSSPPKTPHVAPHHGEPES